MKQRQTLAYLVSLTTLLVFAAIACTLSQPAHAQKRTVVRSATTFPTTGSYAPPGLRPATRAQFAGQLDDAVGRPRPKRSIITNPVDGDGPGNGPSVRSGKRAKSHPVVNVSFEGLNAYQTHYARGGNQFVTEPPDQGLCVGNGFVVEVINSALNIYNTSGQSVLPDNTATNIYRGYPRDVNHTVDLNSFYGYAPTIDYATGIRAQIVMDPTCLYDAATDRFFVVTWVRETRPDGAYTGANHFDIAVSQTGDPTGGWNIYRIDTTYDGTSVAGPPYDGDQPRIGADANGFYVSTNAYRFYDDGRFSGAQIYALSKAQLAAGAANVTMVHIDTTGMVRFQTSSGATVRQAGFSVIPAQSPGSSTFNLDDGGTEYFLSSNAQYNRYHQSNMLILWRLTNTSSLNSAEPALRLTNRVVTTGWYVYPPKQQQPGSGTLATTNTPAGYALNDTTTALFNGMVGAWWLVVDDEPAHDEVISQPDSNDTRMQQVMYANGKLWAAIGTALLPDGGAVRAGIAWYILNPASARVMLQGYLGTTGYDLTYPAIGVTESGRGVIAFTATGDSLCPSAAYAPIDAIAGVGSWDIVPGGQGQAPHDGFTAYKPYGTPIRARWGDYGAAAVDGKTIWIASEYIAHPLSYTDWGGPYILGGTGDNVLGTGGGSSHGPGVRTILSNWSTRITQLTP